MPLLAPEQMKFEIQIELSRNDSMAKDKRIGWKRQTHMTERYPRESHSSCDHPPDGADPPKWALPKGGAQ